MFQQMPRLNETKIQALRAIPGAASLLEAVADRPGVHLVGGAVRDLMLGFAQFDFDLVTEGDATELAEHLRGRIGGSVRSHPQFLTANFRSADDSLSVDIARTRSERYSAPGALPDVAPSTLEEDLLRRDFTVNAMALALWGDRFGELTEHPDAAGDLLGRRLRVTHDRSFIDDPTRLLRLLRYGARLGFSAEPHTEELARDAVEEGAPATVGGSRIRDELLDLLAERSAVVAIEAMCALGLDRALHPEFDADEYVSARGVRELVDGVRQDLLLLALGSRAMGSATLTAWLEHLKLRRGEMAIVEQAVASGPQLLERLATAGTPSARDALLRPLRAETVVFALALPGADRELTALAREWLRERNAGRLEISGADLRDAGVREGPAIGRALAATLDATLDGAIAGRAQQLEHALARAREPEA
jgi:tRNA nucleotidyltransferase (CCA-adding enzyme)